MSDRKKIAKPLKMKMAKYTPRYWFDTPRTRPRPTTTANNRGTPSTRTRARRAAQSPGWRRANPSFEERHVHLSTPRYPPRAPLPRPSRPSSCWVPHWVVADADVSRDLRVSMDLRASATFVSLGRQPRVRRPPHRCRAPPSSPRNPSPSSSAHRTSPPPPRRHCRAPPRGPPWGGTAAFVTRTRVVFPSTPFWPNT